MKKKLFTICFILTIINVFGQNFPENNPKLLLNKTVKPKEINEALQQYSYKNFFVSFNKDKKQFTKDDKKNKPFSSGPSYLPVSDYKKLIGKEFKVIEIFEITPKYTSSDKEYAIEIENPEIGKIFYKYDPRYEHNFELEVVGDLDYPEDFFCSKIKNEKDKFEDTERFYTPSENGISFMKTISKGKSIIFLSVSNYGSSLSIAKKGLTILFEDGTKFTKSDANIDTKANSGRGYFYSVFIQLTQEEIIVFKEKNIADSRVYAYDNKIKEDSAKKIRAYLKCLTK